MLQAKSSIRFRSTISFKTSSSAQPPANTTSTKQTKSCERKREIRNKPVLLRAIQQKSPTCSFRTSNGTWLRFSSTNSSSLPFLQHDNNTWPHNTPTCHSTVRPAYPVPNTSLLSTMSVTSKEWGGKCVTWARVAEQVPSSRRRLCWTAAGDRIFDLQGE